MGEKPFKYALIAAMALGFIGCELLFAGTRNFPREEHITGGIVKFASNYDLWYNLLSRIIKKGGMNCEPSHEVSRTSEAQS